MPPCAPPIPLLPGAMPPVRPTVLPPPPPPVQITPLQNIVEPPPPEPPPPPVNPVLAPRFVSDLPLANVWVRYFLATLCRASYAPTDTYTRRAMAAVFGTTATLTYVANAAGMVPGYAVLKLPQGAIVCISGTSNLAQWESQILQSGLVDYQKPDPGGPASAVGTLPMYKTVAERLFTALAPLVPDAQQILWCGHSMGGAIATLMHGTQTQTPNQRAASRCVTFAAPKAGDSRLMATVRSGQQVYQRFAAIDDVVPLLPPNLRVLELVVPAALAAFAADWSKFGHPTNALYQTNIVNYVADNDPALLNALGAALLAAARGNPMAVSDAHGMANWIGSFGVALTLTQTAPPAAWNNGTDLHAVNSALTAAGL